MTEPYNAGYRNGYYDRKYLHISLTISQLRENGEYALGYAQGQKEATAEKELP